MISGLCLTPYGALVSHGLVTSRERPAVSSEGVSPMVGLLCQWLGPPDHPSSQARTGLDLQTLGLEGDVGPGWTRLSLESCTQPGNR